MSSHRLKKDQITFDDIQRSVRVQELSDKDRRILLFLREGNTQSQIVQKIKVPKSTVSQTVRKLKEANLISEKWAGNYNKIYDVAQVVETVLQKEGVPKITPFRVHYIAMKYSILKQEKPVCVDERAGWSKSWKMRGGIKWHAFSHPGKAGEIDCTVTVTPKTIVIRMDAGQKITAETAIEAQNRGFQHLGEVRRRFVEKQKLFGVRLDIESTGKVIARPHAGLAFHEGGSLDSATRIPGTWVDESNVKELGPGFKEFEMHTDHDLMTPLEKGVLAVAGMPDLIKLALDPLHQSMDSMTAHMQAMTTPQIKINEQTQMILHLMKENGELRRRVELLEGNRK